MIKAKSKKILIYPCYCIFFPMILCVGVKAAEVIHAAVTSAVQGVDVVIIAGTSGSIMAVHGKLFFRQIGEKDYIGQPMFKSGGDFRGRIPSEHVKNMGVEYYIILYLADGKVITSPEQNPIFMPHVVIIAPAKQEWFEVLYPEQDSVIENMRPQISVAFEPGAIINPGSINIKLDGKDVTSDCEITQDFLLYMPSEELRPGIRVITLTNTDDPEMIGSWQFTIAGAATFWQQLSGSTSVAYQWTHVDSDSPFIIYSPGSSFGLSMQIAGQFAGKSFDAWMDRSAFYQSRANDFGMGVYGSKIRISVGDIFPSISKLTLDGIPARGIEAYINPSNKVTIQLIGAEARFFTDSEDDFMASLLNSNFGGFQAAIKPFGEVWEISALYIHARNYTDLESDTLFSMEKRNDLYSLRTELDLPAEFALYGEWVSSSHLTRYCEDFASEFYRDVGISMGVSKHIKSIALELFYLNVGDEFFSEVNPFVESGRNGFGFSLRYSHRIGLSALGEYGRYERESNINTEARVNVSLSVSKLPSVFVAYYQQRVPYGKYDIRGASLGVSYKLWRMRFSANGSYSTTNLWTDNLDRDSVSSSVGVEYEITNATNFGIDYSRFGSYRSSDISRRQRKMSTEIRRRIGRSHSLIMDLSEIKFVDKNNCENDYLERLFLLKYSYSF